MRAMVRTSLPAVGPLLLGASGCGLFGDAVEHLPTRGIRGFSVSSHPPAMRAIHCDVPTTVTLTILPGSIAKLVSKGSGVIDHSNRTQDSSGTPVSWIAAGTAADGVATFSSCNEGRFQGSGRMDYGIRELTGAVTCGKDGTHRVTGALG